MFSTRTTRAFAAAVALAVAPAALITPHSAAAVTATAAQVAGVSPRLELSANPQVLPAPAAKAAAVVVPAATLPPQPPARTAHDAPALAAHAAAVKAVIDQTAAAHAAAAHRLVTARTAVASADQQLRAAQKQAAKVGAPVPAAPTPPPAPPVTTPDGKPAPVQASTPVVAATVAAATPAPVLTVPAPAATLGNVADQVAALKEGTSAQDELAAAQATLVEAATAEAVTATQLVQLTGALQANEQALVTLPPPDPRWPDGCPTDAPDGTLRNGAASIGIAQLCADSVAAAATPQAALAIKWALSHLDMPYSQPRRNEDGFADCSSFVSRAYTAAGVPLVTPGVNAPTTDTIATAAWAQHISPGAAAPGDLIEPNPGHVVMLLAHGFIVHTAHDGDVSHVRNVYFDASYLTLRIDPAHAGS